MSEVVVDASVAVKWFVAEAGSDRALGLLSDGVTRIAPEFVIAEVDTALSRRERQGEKPSGQALVDIRNLRLYFSEFVPSSCSASPSACGHSVSMPTPLRKIDRRMMRK